MSKQNKSKNNAHLFVDGGMDIGGMTTGVLQFANGLASYGKERKANEELYNNAIDNTRVGLSGMSSINNYDSLEDYLNSTDQLHELELNDLIGNDAHKAGKYLQVSSQAAQAGGASGNAFGFLAGSIIGQIGAGIAGRRNRNKARKSLANINQKIRDTNDLQTAMIDNRLNNIEANQMADQQWNYIAALGGNLHSNSTTWNNGLNYIGNGGSHESNPNDGVAISTAPDGLQNKVEEGEVVWNDAYVFSKRLKVPKKDLEKNKWKGETYADIAKKLMDESAERPNDPITLRGLDDALSRLKDSQEELKAKQEGNKIKKEIASIPPELLAQMQQQAQQPTEEELMQQQATEQIPQEQMPMVDPSMQQPMMEQPPMYAKGGHLFLDGSFLQGTGVSPLSGGIDYTANNIADYRMGQNSAFRYKDLQAREAQHNDLMNQQNSGMNKAGLFQGIAQGINLTGSFIDSLPNSYKGGDLNALYKGTKHGNAFSKNLNKAIGAYKTIGFIPDDEGAGWFKNGGHLFAPGGGSVKAVSGKGFIAPLPSPQIEKIGSTRIPTLDEMESAKVDAMSDYINKKAEYVNVNDAQKYGGFYNNVNKINEYLNGSTPMDVKNIAQGVANQQSREAGEAFINRFPVKKNYGLGDNAYILNKNDQESINFFLKNNPNLNLDSDTIYFYNKDKNDTADKNKSVKANKVKKETYDKNSVENIKEMSGINFNRTNIKAKGGHLYSGEDEYTQWLAVNNLSDTELNRQQFSKILQEESNNRYNNWLSLVNRANNATAFEISPLSTLNSINPQTLQTASPQLIRKTYTPEEQRQIAKIEKDVVKREAKAERVTNKESKDRNLKFDPTYMRYAPVLGSIFNIARSIADRPDYGNPERIERAAARVGAQVSPKYIGDYLRYRPLDEAYYLNQLNTQQNAANNAIVGLSNGNRSMALASMLANDYNYNNQRGAAYRQGLEYNEAQRQRAAEFNRGTNQFNAQQYMQAAAQNASNRAQAANLIASAAQMREAIDNAYGASQSANWTNLFNNIGNVGRDEMNRKMTNGLYDYGWLNRSGDWGFNGQSRNGKRGGYLTIKTNNRRKE